MKLPALEVMKVDAEEKRMEAEEKRMEAESMKYPANPSSDWEENVGKMKALQIMKQ